MAVSAPLRAILSDLGIATRSRESAMKRHLHSRRDMQESFTVDDFVRRIKIVGEVGCRRYWHLQATAIHHCSLLDREVIPFVDALEKAAILR